MKTVNPTPAKKLTAASLSPSLSRTQAIAPAFASDETGERSVAENTAAGEDIGDPFTATDADTDGEVTYKLGGADAGSFDIDEHDRPVENQGQHWTMKWCQLRLPIW